MPATWMVIEDEQDLYDMILTMYDLLGFKGLAFAVGSDAMDWIEDIDEGLVKEVPQLALIDIRLPDEYIDGVHIAARFRQSKHLQNTAICLMTAFKFTPTEEKQIMAESQADMLLYKPLPTFRDLRRILFDLVEDKKAQQREPHVKPNAPIASEGMLQASNLTRRDGETEERRE